MTGWLTRLRDRPIAEHERRAALAGVLAILAIATIALTFTRPATRERKTAGATGSATAQHVTARTGPVPLTPVGIATAKRFLEGYLAYIYGHAPAASVKDTTRSFARALLTEGLRVTPAMRALTPRVVALSPATSPAGLVGVRALVNDGSLIDYPIILRLERRDGRLLVAGLGGA